MTKAAREELLKQAFFEGFVKRCNDLTTDLMQGASFGGLASAMGGSGLEAFRQVLDENRPEMNIKKILLTGLGSGLGGAAGGMVGGGLNHMIDPSNRFTQELLLRLPILAGSVAGAKLIQDKKVMESKPVQHGKEILGKL